MADCTFDELCSRALWTNDYLKMIMNQTSATTIVTSKEANKKPHVSSPTLLH